jgi:cobalt-zinc-cadmium efflux system membrane fusion protein
MRTHVLTALVFAALVLAFGWVATDGRLPWTAPPDRGPGWCAPHDVELARCEICNPKLARGGTVTTRLREPNEGECPNTLVRIELGPGAAEAAGLLTAEVAARPIAETIRANGETMWPPGRLARVAPRISGVVREVRVGLGEEVAAGAPLAVLECAELAAAKSAYVRALATLELRQKTYDAAKGLFDKRLLTGREVLEAETEKEEARLESAAAESALRGLGLDEAAVKAVASQKETSSLLTVSAPFDGAVVETAAVVGEISAPDRPLFAVAALDRMWVSADVTEADLGRVAKDQKVVFFVEGLAGKRFAGRVAAIGGEVDDRTRTVRVFADVKNAEGLLRAKMFGRAEIAVRAAEPVLLVPKESVQNDGDCDLVFVRTGTNVFQARAVELGAAFEGGYEVKAGLTAGEVVATRGAFLLKTEVLRGQMGAG